MLSPSVWRPTLTRRGVKVFVLSLISVCSLVLVINVSFLADSGLASAPPPPPEFIEHNTWNTRQFIHRNTVAATDRGLRDDAICSAFPTDQLEKIQVVLKIGADEITDKIKASLATVTACISDLLIFSDLAERIENHDVIDVLAGLPASYSEDNPDFSIYTNQRKESNETDKHPGPQGWKLDRFKFLPMVEKAYTMRPHKSWYIFLEADTYLSWDNMYRFLGQFDPNTALYMGSPVAGSSRRWFAHGGSGFVLSRRAIEKLLAPAEAKPEQDMSSSIHKEFEKMVKEDCCGDAVLAYALLEKGVSISGYYPLFNGYNSEGLKLNAERWCHPIMTLHHIGPEEMLALWEWEMGRPDNKNPLLYSDIFRFIHRRRMRSTRIEWDNLSGWPPRKKKANKSLRACADACRSDPLCLQYSHFNQECKIEHNLRLGRSRAMGGTGLFTSGWELERIAQLQQKQCDVARWPTASVARHD